MVEDGHHSHAANDNNGASQPPSPPPSAVMSGNLTFAATTTTTTNLTAVDSSGATSKIHREPLSTIGPQSRESVKKPLISREKFHWNQKDQGHILGAFFYGYIVFQIPGARLAESVGAKWILLAANAGSALISLIFPLSTQLNSIHLLMVLRFLMGLCQSAFFPAAYVLFCRWLPEKERAILLPIMFIGSNMGSISTYIMSSYLISNNYGWPSVFYVSGLICALVTLMWTVFGSNEPSDNWFITEEECLFIEGNVNNQSSETNSLNGQTLLAQTPATAPRSRIGSLCEPDHHLMKLNNKNYHHHHHQQLAPKIQLQVVSRQQQQQHQEEEEAIKLQNKRPRTKSMNSQLSLRTGPASRPADLESLQSSRHHHNHQLPKQPAQAYDNQLSWPKLIKSVPVWTLILSMYGNEWSNAVLCYELPTYLNSALAIPIDQNGVLNSFFQLSYTLVSPVVSSVGAHMLDRHAFGMHKIHVRKLFQSLATFGQLACFISVPICGANSGLIIMFMFSAIVFKACANAGDIMVPGDLSPGK